MRPTRLDLAGFASFRQPTTLDFDDADLFVLSGPTGSGKTSIVDGIVFCLYGIVPRYGDKRLVAPVISNGRNEARVRLQFSVGTDRYTAVRVVRRTPTGASTKEARLERWRGDDPGDAAVLASTADELTETVEAILGLGYEHFTTTVVLPQGAFQRFLHAKASERQGLLVELLDLEVFGRIGRAARAKAANADARVGVLTQQLDARAGQVTDAAIDDAARQVEGLATALARIDAARPDLDDILEEGRERSRRVRELTAQRDALQDVEAPDDLAELAGHLDAARTAAEVARTAQERARTRRRELDQVVDDLPSSDAVTAQRTRLERATTLAAQIEESIEAVTASATASEEAGTAVDATQQAVAEARQQLERAREADLVATLAADLEVGDPCPVCERPLDDAVTVHDEVVGHARTRLAETEEALADARRTAAKATSEASRAEERHRQLTTQQERVHEELAATDLPTDPDALAGVAEQVSTAIERRRAARVAESEAEAALAAADRDLQVAHRGLESARAALDETRDRLAVLHPPSPDRDDPAAAWQAMLAWVDEQRPVAARRLVEAERATTAAREAYAERLNALRADLGDHDVDTAGINQAGPLRDAFVTAHAAAASHHRSLVDLRERQRDQQAQLARARRDSAVATDLGRLLNRNNFEKWLLARAVNRLVIGASRHLQDLTRGAYTLRLEPDASFGIVDHANGGEIRSARTLSGGETFLASLSLALALSDHVVDLAADGAARLESLFIDEGFGTLDAATIDVVRTALEELGSSGRMVGVVTHVQALAEQLPVQFQVRKESQSSVVERIDL